MRATTELQTGPLRVVSYRSDAGPTPSPLPSCTRAARSPSCAFHFVRVFSQVLGVTPHQYLVRSRASSRRVWTTRIGAWPVP